MTISNTIRTAGPFIGNGIATAFPFNFKIFKSPEVLAVRTEIVTGIATSLVIDSDYTVTMNPDQDALPGGTVTTSIPLAFGQTLVLTSQLEYLQPIDITNGGGFYPAVINAALDRLTIFCQQLFSLASRSLKLPLSDVAINTELPNATERANKLLGFDQNGTPIVTAPVSGSGAEVAIELANAKATYLSSLGASLIGYIQAGAGAVRRTLQDKLRDEVWVNDFGAKGNLIDLDDAAFFACEKYARENKKTMRAADGQYLLDQFVFGTQSETGQSAAPLGFIGASREGTRLVQRASSTSTLFKARSLAGVTIRDFSIDTSATANMALDMEWRQGVGPSAQDELRRIRVDGGTAPVHVSLINLNDTYPSELTVNATNPSQCCIDARQPGGLLVMDRCIWNGGFLRASAQNMDLPGCWGFGIEFAQNAVNNISLPGGYIYPNEWKGGTIWSEAPASPFQSLHSLTIGPGTQIITSANNGNWVLNIRALSSVKLEGVEFKSLGGTVNMWGPDCARDSFQNVAVLFEGGSFDSQININEPAQFDVSYQGFINKQTGYAYRNSTKNYFASGGNTGTFGGGVWYDLVPAGTMIAGVYLLSFAWDHNGAGVPYLVNATALITVPGLTEGIPGDGADIPGSVGQFNITNLTAVKFRLSATASTGTPKIQFHSSTTLPSPGILTWSLTKIA